MGSERMIQNPILKGFHADPCLCRKGDDYYIACSSFEWLPGIPVYHSRDLKHWELYTHIITKETQADLTKLPSAKGIWAPDLTYNEEEDRFYAVYGVMNSMNARYFDLDNYLITAKDIKGPWSEPVYLHSAGFDASLFHDDNGKKWLLSLLWETRDGYPKPGPICIAEYDSEKQCLKGYPKPIYHGGTDRGCLEAPHLYKHNGLYYLMCAEGGTGYYHCVTMARSTSPDGEYLPDPTNPILTSVPENHDERDDTDHLKTQYFNPDAPLQKAGHGSLTETQDGEVYMAFLTARPFLPELRCTLGRETALQKMVWTKDGWLRTESGTNLVQPETLESHLPEKVFPDLPARDTFRSPDLMPYYYAPRIFPESFTDLTSRKGKLRLRGQESLSSANKVSLLARKLTSVHATVTAKMEFTPEIYQHSAGLVLYYDNMNYLFLRKTYSESLSSPALLITRVTNGVKTDFCDSRVRLQERPVSLRLCIDGKQTHCEWGYDEKNFRKIGIIFDTTKFSDEYSRYGEFTGTFVGVAAVDAMFHSKAADFDYFEYIAQD